MYDKQQEYGTLKGAYSADHLVTINTVDDTTETNVDKMLQSLEHPGLTNQDEFESEAVNDEKDLTYGACRDTGRNQTTKHSSALHPCKETDTKSTKHVEDTTIYPDGGWGWIVTAATFILSFVSLTPNVSFGILFSRFLGDLGSSANMTAWIFNLALTNAGLFTFLLGPLVDECGWRSVTFVASFVLAVGFILCAIAPAAWFLFISFSIILGPTIDIGYTIGYMVIPHYFNHRRNVANAIMNSGGCLSQIVMPPFITYLQEEYGVRGAMLIMGAITLNSCAAAMVLHPVEWHTQKSSANVPKPEQNTKLSDVHNSLNPFKILNGVIRTMIQYMQYMKTPSIVLTSLVLAMIFVVAFNAYALVPFTLHESGYSQYQSSLCLAVAGLLNLVFRALTATFDCCPRITIRSIFLLGECLAATGFIGFSLSKDMVGYIISMVLSGVGYGLAGSLYSLYIVEQYGLPLLNPILSLTGFMMGILLVTIGPATGLVHDAGGNYKGSMGFCGACLMFAVVLGLCIPAIRDCENNRDVRNKNISE